MLSCPQRLTQTHTFTASFTGLPSRGTLLIAVASKGLQLFSCSHSLENGSPMPSLSEGIILPRPGPGPTLLSSTATEVAGPAPPFTSSGPALSVSGKGERQRGHHSSTHATLRKKSCGARSHRQDWFASFHDPRASSVTSGKVCKGMSISPAPMPSHSRCGVEHLSLTPTLRACSLAPA